MQKTHIQLFAHPRGKRRSRDTKLSTSFSLKRVAQLHQNHPAEQTFKDSVALTYTKQDYEEY